MLTQSILRGACAGLFAGLIAGLFALAVAEPSIDTAIAIEEAAAGATTADLGSRSPGSGAESSAHSHSSEAHDHASEPAGSEVRSYASGANHSHGSDHSHASEDGLSRATQKLGLVVGMMLYGLSLGAMFGVAFAWSIGRVRGDAWIRAIKLGCVSIGALVLLPALSYPPNPPAVGDPSTVGSRTGLFLIVWISGLGIATCAWASLRRLERQGWSPPVAQVIAGLGVCTAVALLLFALPAGAGAPGFPADVLWTFRVSAVATQAVLFGGIAVLYGLLAMRERHPHALAG